MSDRLQHIRVHLQRQSLDALLVTSVPHIIWLTGYSGFSLVERECYLLITQTRACLFTDLRYTEAVKVLVQHFQTKEINGRGSLGTQLTAIAKDDALERIGFEADNITVAEYSQLRKSLAGLTAVDLSQLRVQKSTEEIAAIQNACQIGDEIFSYILEQIRPGMTEKEVVLKMELFAKEKGADMSFLTIAAFGTHAAVPHHMTDETKLKKNDVILLDFGVRYDSYCSDMTRTIFIGKPTAEQKKVYEAVLTAQQKAVEYINTQSLSFQNKFTRNSGHSQGTSFPEAAQARMTNILASDVDKAAREYIVSQGYPSIPHSLGHGIGIEVHEAPSLSPRSENSLADGMVFSIEPGIYLNGKFGVRIEDLFAIQNGKLCQLTHSPSTLTQI